MRRVIFVWLPDLATERLRRTGCAPPDRPLALTMAAGQVQRVVAVDPLARQAGLRPGATLADSLAQAPDLISRPAQPMADQRLLEGLSDWCTRYSPLAAPADHGLWLDITGCAHLWDGEAGLLADLTARLTRQGFSVRAAIADTPGAAWAWAHHGRGNSPILPPGRPRDALAPLPLAALRLNGATIAGLEAVGLRVIGDLLGMARAPLAARFGPEPGRRLDQALGDLPEPISPLAPVAPHRVQRAFAEPIGRTEAVEAALEGLLAELCRRLDGEEMGLRRIEVSLFRVDAAVLRLSVGTGRPSRDAPHLLKLLRPQLDSLDAGFGIETIAVAALGLAALAPEQARLGAASAAAADGQARCARLFDALTARLGDGRVARLLPHSSHVPEQAVLRCPPLARFDPQASWPVGRRPIRLFDPPEPVEAVAPIPDNPPVLFRWRRTTHRIRLADGPERIADAWWKEHTPTRDYYCVEDETGQRFWLYREGWFGADPPPRWFLHGLVS
ncbi:Y-family DNA polymerase [Magnetospirillum moscoviense]|uniref:Y-family DNA polymerase n=1 Tax=Magnetospirillum moscoviense TaxID=1437059 RepID=UPI0009EF5102|nr:DNA polymerase Y family protein [Magnetospirillum moscoviense]